MSQLVQMPRPHDLRLEHPPDPIKFELRNQRVVDDASGVDDAAQRRPKSIDRT